MSCWDTTWSRDQRVAPPTSMYSMNRTSASWARANSIRSVSSSSLNPRITTALSLSLAKPACRAAAMPSSTSACRVLPEQQAVGRDGQVTDSRVASDHRDERREIVAEQRLAAREPDLVHPEPCEHAGEPLDLLEGEDRGPRQPRVIVLRHAVTAAQVAAVRHGQPQARERASQRVVDDVRHATVLLLDGPTDRKSV